MYCTGAGRAYLSGLPDEEIHSMLQNSEPTALTQYTLTEVAAIFERIQACRTQGYATSHEEMVLGDLSIAAPILNNNGLPVAAVHAVVPASRWTMADAELKLAPAVVQCARSISRSICTL